MSVPVVGQTADLAGQALRTTDPTGTALGEAVYFWLKLGTDPARVLSANLMTSVGIRPSWVVLAITVGLVLAGQLMQLGRLRPT